MSAGDPHHAESAADARTRWDVVGLAVCSGLMLGIAVGKVPAALSVISADFGLDKVTAGWLASIFFAVGAGLSVVTGMAGSLIGARTLLLWGLGILALASFVGAWSSGGDMLLVLRVIEGVSFATITVSAPKLVFDASAVQDRNLTLGIWSAYMPAGMAIALLVSPFLIPFMGWRGVWLIAAGITLVVAVLAFGGTTHQRWPSQARPEPGAGFDWAGVRATVPRSALWLYAGAFVLFTVEWFAVAAWLPIFLIETQGRSTLTAALFSALVVATNVVGNLSGAWLMHRGVPRWALIGLANATMGVTAALILGAFTPDAVKVPLAIVFSAGSGVLPAAAFSGAAVHAPKPHLVAMASGFVVQGAATGMLLGPPLMAIVVGGLGGWENAWWAMLICPAIGLAIAAGVLTLERR